MNRSKEITETTAIIGDSRRIGGLNSFCSLALDEIVGSDPAARRFGNLLRRITRHPGHATRQQRNGAFRQANSPGEFALTHAAFG